MRNDFESNYLAHHGILGMKWGKKNGPPYPLKPSDHSSAEKKAGWRKSLEVAGKVANSVSNSFVKGGPVPGQIESDKAMRSKAGMGSTTYESNREANKKMEDMAKSASSKAKEIKNVLKSDSGSRSSKALKDARKKDIDELSTQELRDINNRLREEKSYQELTKGNIAEGKRFTSQLSKQIATGILTGVAIEAGKAFIKSIPSKMPYLWTSLIRILA